MKIDLYYDPSVPETRVRVDGQWTDPADIYGLFYPVRRHLLQAWLMPSGSWSGLARQLAEVARGDKVALTFHGREIDYADVAAALQDAQDTTLDFEAWTTPPDRAAAPASARLMALLGEDTVMERDGDAVITRTGGELFEDFAASLARRLPEKPLWLSVISTDDDLERARLGGGCCLVESAWLDSYEKLPLLEGLTRSMRRAQDMIVCRLPGPEAAGDYERFNSQCGGIAARFVSLEDDSWRDELWAKYGEPIERAYGHLDDQAVRRAVEELLALKADVDAKVRALRRQDDDEEERTLWEYRQLWLNKRKNALLALMEAPGALDAYKGERP